MITNNGRSKAIARCWCFLFHFLFGGTALKTFSDGKNQWSIEIGVGSIKRVLADTGLNLSLPHEPDADGRTLAERLVFDIVLQVDVIWSLVRLQAEKLSISVDDFCHAMKADLMLAAVEAFQGEWIDFFQKMNSPVQAKIIQQARELRQELQTKGLAQVERIGQAKTDFITNQMKKEVDAALKQMEELENPTLTVFSGNVTGSAEKSESLTSTDAPGDSSSGQQVLVENPIGKSRRS